MNILYGVSGEGFGHSSRASVVIDYLQKKGHKVKVITYGQGYEALKDKHEVFKVRGLHMIFEKSLLKKRKTFLFNIKNFPKNLLRWKKFHNLMKEFKPDLCITDMEPIVPILRYWYNLPLVSLDNQHRLTNLKFDVPDKHNNDFLIARKTVNAFVRKADYFVVTSFVKAPLKKGSKKNTFVVPPIVREEVKKLKPKYDDKILVYLTKKDKGILKILQGIDEKFVVYGYNKNKTKDNLEFKVKDGFLRDLASCKAVIATAGFTLMSEAIYLKKPYFALPLKGQFEQTLNALFLKKAGFGEYSEEFNYEELVDFLSKLSKYKKKLKEYNPDYNELYKVLDKVIK